MSLFKFADKSICYGNGEVFIARVDPTIADTDELLRSLYYLLWFPGYFGLNWNSLYGCLRDLDWISENKIMIVHESLPNIPDADLCIYLGVLKDSVLDWTNDEGHQLEILFHEKDKKQLKDYYHLADTISRSKDPGLVPGSLLLCTENSHLSPLQPDHTGCGGAGCLRLRHHHKQKVKSGCGSNDG